MIAETRNQIVALMEIPLLGMLTRMVAQMMLATSKSSARTATRSPSATMSSIGHPSVCCGRSGERACVIVSQWLTLPQVVVVVPGESFWSIFVEQVKRAQVLGPLVTDAALAALAIESGATLCSTDRDFLRFEGLKLVDPTR
jgi:hypothetical protein